MDRELLVQSLHNQAVMMNTLLTMCTALVMSSKDPGMVSLLTSACRELRHSESATHNLIAKAQHEARS